MDLHSLELVLPHSVAARDCPVKITEKKRFFQVVIQRP